MLKIISFSKIFTESLLDSIPTARKTTFYREKI